MEIECVGQVFENGKITIDPALLSEMKVGAKISLKITVPEKKHKRKAPKDLSPAAKQFLEMLDNARPSGFLMTRRKLAILGWPKKGWRRNFLGWDRY